MIIVGAKNTGKKLVNAITRALHKDGTVQVAALSDKGVQQINFAGQKIANQLLEKNLGYTGRRRSNYRRCTSCGTSRNY
jgi:hypothetical protein